MTDRPPAPPEPLPDPERGPPAPQGHAVAAMDNYATAFPSALPRPPLRDAPTHHGKPRRRR